MSLLCYVGRHTPSLASIARGKRGGYAALCQSCGVPLERDDGASWHAAAPMGGHSHPRTRASQES